MATTISVNRLPLPANTAAKTPGTLVLRDSNGAAALDVTGNVIGNLTGTASAVADSSVTNAKVATNAAIAGTKVSPDFGSQNITTTGTIAAAPGSVISGSSSSDALRITQTGSGNALLVEDITNPDATPFVVRNDGKVVQGHTTWESWWFSSSNAPQANLVNTSGGAGANAIGFGTHGVFQMIRSNSATVDGRGAVSSGDLLGTVRFAADDGSSASAVPAAQILGLVDGTPGALDMPGRLVFSTTAPAASNPTERMRIDSAGNVGIGLTNAGSRLEVRANGLSSGTVRFAACADVSSVSNFLSTDSVLFVNNAGAGDSGIHFRANTEDYSIRATDSGELLFEDDATERMRIDSSGNVGIGGTANADAILDLQSTTKGFLPPRMTTTQRDAIAAPIPAGLMVYNTTTNKLNFYNGSAWEAVTSS